MFRMGMIIALALSFFGVASEEEFLRFAKPQSPEAQAMLSDLLDRSLSRSRSCLYRNNLKNQLLYCVKTSKNRRS
jgi:hypothetical protein